MMRHVTWMRSLAFLAFLAVAGAALYVMREPEPLVPPGADWKQVALEQRRQGRFDDAARLLREVHATTADEGAWRMLLGIVEDMGDARELVREARTFLVAHPGDPDGELSLARGLLFAAATDPSDPEAPAWIDEALGLADRLEKVGYRSHDAPGAVDILRAQAAFLQHRWEEADRLAARGLELGTTPGESGDLLSMRFDLALRAGDLERAEKLLEEALRLVEGWPPESYYQLRTYREEALVVREIYFGKPFTEKDLQELEASQRDLRDRGFVDPTMDDGGKATASAHDSMRQWIAAREAGDRERQLQMVEGILAQERAHKPRCFYSEAVATPFQPVYYHLLAGRLCLDLGRREAARAHFEAALQAHPGDRLLQAELEKVL